MLACERGGGGGPLLASAPADAMPADSVNEDSRLDGKLIPKRFARVANCDTNCSLGGCACG